MTRFSLIIFIFNLLAMNSFGQNIKPVRTFDDSPNQYDLENHGYLLIITESLDSFKLPILIAKSFFPELDSTKIKVHAKRLSNSINATTRPAIFSMIFKGKSNRTYVIRVNSSLRKEKRKINGVPFNALIGLFGHEISHILDYTGRTNCQMFRLGLSYLNRKSKEQYEKSVDQITIERGLGWQLYDLVNYILADSERTEDYKKYMKDIYLEPSEIESLIKADPQYKDIGTK